MSAATHKQRDLFFVLLQSELGDLYKISLDYSGNAVEEIKIQFFDTVPVASSMCITKTGLLFCASEFSNHYLFQFLSIERATTRPSVPAWPWTRPSYRRSR